MEDLDQLRAYLTDLGKRRKRHNQDKGRLADETTRAVKLAEGRIPTTELADLIGLERTTIYRVYRES